MTARLQPIRRALALALTLALAFGLPPGPAAAQDGRLRIEITEGVIEPLPFAIPAFVAETPAAAELARDLSRVIAADLAGSGLFREIPAEAHIARVSAFAQPVAFADWKAVNAQALVVGAVSVGGDGRVSVKFRLYDVFAEAELGDGLQLGGTTASWRRIAHKVADQVYARITGE